MRRWCEAFVCGEVLVASHLAYRKVMVPYVRSPAKSSGVRGRDPDVAY